MAESIIMPRIIAIGCNQRRLYPASTPRKRLDANDPPPRVMALCNQPGPESLVYAPNLEKIPEASA
jgi:hypothetical protein